MLFVHEARALRLRQDQVEEEEETQIAVEGDPGGRFRLSDGSRPLPPKGGGGAEEGGGTDQRRRKEVQDSSRRQQLRTTQYMSQGVSWAGSDVLRALYEAKMGKRTEARELCRGREGQPPAISTGGPGEGLPEEHGEQMEHGEEELVPGGRVHDGGPLPSRERVVLARWAGEAGGCPGSEEG